MEDRLLLDRSSTVERGRDRGTGGGADGLRGAPPDRPRRSLEENDDEDEEAETLGRSPGTAGLTDPLTEGGK